MKKRLYLLRTGVAMLMLPLISSCTITPTSKVKDSATSAKSTKTSTTSGVFSSSGY